jgi:hypothetical protein
MFDDFCSDCQFRQGPMMQPMGQGGCGAQAAMMQQGNFGGQMPIQGSMGIPSMQIPMQGSMGIPSMQMPIQGSMGVPSMQMPGNIYQQVPGTASMGVPGQQPMGGQMMPTGQFGPSPIPGVTFPEAPGSPVAQDTNYIQGYLRTLIGRYVRIDFLIGTNMIVDREGTLIDVGISYVVLREAQTDDNVMCDIYSIKFVKVFY